MHRIGVITNPHAAGGRGLAHREDLERAAGPDALVLQTRALDELPDAVDELARAGCRYWVADGGDGTLHWLLSTWHQRRQDPTSPAHAGPDPVFLPTRGGSIDFVAHKIGLRGGGVAVVRRLRERLARRDEPDLIPLGTLRVLGVAPAVPGARLGEVPATEGPTSAPASPATEDDADEPRGSRPTETPRADLPERLAFAAALAGVAQRFFDLLYEHPTVHPGHIVKLLAAGALGPAALGAPRPLRERLPRGLVRRAEHLFARTRAHVDIDGSALPFDDIGSAQIGAIDIDLGGVVRTFRKARRPGVLHAQVVGMGPAGIVANLPSVVLGTPLVGPRVFDDTCERLTMAPTNGHRLTPILDGEPYTCPGAVSVCAGPALSFASV